MVDSRHSTPTTILVTGCAGFIGARVCEMLLSAGQPVLGLDNLNDAYDVRLKAWRMARFAGCQGFAFRRVDIADRQALAEAVAEAAGERISAVINLAARAGVRYSVENPWVYYETNVIGTLNLLELCRQRHVGKFVLASSSSVYGDDNPLPYCEEQPTDRALSPYAASKKAAETLAYTYYRLYGIDVTVFRYFTVYGPAGRPDMLPFRLVQRIFEGRTVTIYGDGSQSRDFTYIDDIARGTVAGLKPLGYEVINLGSDHPVGLMEVLRIVERLVGRQAVIEHLPRHPADVTATWADIGKARRLLGWRPESDLEAGIGELVAWYRRERAWAKDVCTS